MDAKTIDAMQDLQRLFDSQPDDRYAPLRAAAWEKFKEQGWPGRRNEEYKFTALDNLIGKKVDFGLTSFALHPDINDIQREFYKIEGYHLAFINGQYHPEVSVLPHDGLTIKAFSLLSDEELMQVNAALPDQRATVAINQAFFSNGVWIQAKKSRAALPVFIYHFVGADQRSMGFPRIHISADENAQLRCYEKTFVLSGIGHFSSHVTTVDVARHAMVRFTKIQNYRSSDCVLDNLFVQQDADSHFFANTFSLSGGLIRNNLEISINGEHAEANMYGLYLLDGHSHVDNHTVVDHKVANCNSNELYKGIVDEHATAVFNGKIYVRQPAQKTNAFQANNNISLSDTATIHTKPQLEIWADDVKCSHGCTVGQLDEEALFYLRSRGIRENAAMAMLLNAFAEETLSHVLLEQINDEIVQLIHDRLDA